MYKQESAIDTASDLLQPCRDAESHVSLDALVYTVPGGPGRSQAGPRPSPAPGPCVTSSRSPAAAVSACQWRRQTAMGTSRRPVEHHEVLERRVSRSAVVPRAPPAAARGRGRCRAASRCFATVSDDEICSRALPARTRGTRTPRSHAGCARRARGVRASILGPPARRPRSMSRK